ncbi:hypothetical protein [Natronomonas amylolytica]|uniref:hypothetical protein n=1 Tax=Natronomonas amylolytica TaxID=3108498 RepID=UPI00300A7B95
MTAGESQHTEDSEHDAGEATAPGPSSSHDVSNEERSQTAHTSEPKLASRTLMTWLEITVVGITGGLLGGAVGGPPGFIVYLLTTLITVGIIFHNVNELIKAWLRRSNHTG